MLPDPHPQRMAALLEQTSRTFALSIPLLPQPCRAQVTVAYLLFRVADTWEDADRWAPTLRIAALHDFARLVDAPDAALAARLSQQAGTAPLSTHAGYRALMADIPRLMQAFVGLSEPARGVIAHHTRRTCERMASAVARTSEGGTLRLHDLRELQDYCYAVAGIVGELLTDLFILHEPALRGIEAELRRDAARFGEALQLVNILKDSADDATEGRFYLPVDVPRAAVIALADADLEVAGHYVRAMQTANADRGILAFLALPVLLAQQALRRVERDGPGAKLKRDEVFATIEQMNAALDAGRQVIPSDSGYRS